MELTGLDFSNAVKVTDEALESFGLSFSLGDKDQKKPDLEEETDPTDDDDPEDTKDTKDSKDSKDTDDSLSLGGSKKAEVPSIDFTNVINTLADVYSQQGIELEAYEGFDPNADANEDTLVKLLEHNFKKRESETLDTFFGELSEHTQKIIQYDLNSKGKGVDDYMSTLVEERKIKSLDVENEYDQEKILRQWYKSKEGFSPNEVEEKITELKDASLLEKEAKRIKPKLDLEAENIAKKQEEDIKKLKQIEQQVSNEYQNKVIKTLEKGAIGNIKLDKETLTNVYSFLTNDEMELNTHKGKVSMSPLEALVFFNKYDQKGSVENLALATLLLLDKQKFDSLYSKRAETVKTEEFIKDHKYSNKLKIGGGDTSITTPKKEKEIKTQPSKWNLKI